MQKRGKRTPIKLFTDVRKCRWHTFGVSLFLTRPDLVWKRQTWDASKGGLNRKSIKINSPLSKAFKAGVSGRVEKSCVVRGSFCDHHPVKRKCRLQICSTMSVIVPHVLFMYVHQDGGWDTGIVIRLQLGNLLFWFERKAFLEEQVPSCAQKLQPSSAGPSQQKPRGSEMLCQNVLISITSLEDQLVFGTFPPQTRSFWNTSTSVCAVCEQIYLYGGGICDSWGDSCSPECDWISLSSHYP